MTRAPKSRLAAAPLENQPERATVSGAVTAARRSRSQTDCRNGRVARLGAVADTLRPTADHV